VRSFYSWVIFLCVYVPKLPYPFICQWTSKLQSPEVLKSREYYWTGRPGVLRFMGSQRVRHNWATELNWTEAASLKWWIESSTVSWCWNHPWNSEIICGVQATEDLWNQGILNFSWVTEPKPTDLAKQPEVILICASVSGFPQSQIYKFIHRSRTSQVNTRPNLPFASHVLLSVLLEILTMQTSLDSHEPRCSAGYTNEWT